MVLFAANIYNFQLELILCYHSAKKIVQQISLTLDLPHYVLAVQNSREDPWGKTTYILWLIRSFCKLHS